MASGEIGWCDHYAIPKDLLDRFFSAVKADEPREAIGDLIHELNKTKNLIRCEIGGDSCQDLHRCLTDDCSPNLDFDSGEYPLRLCIHGGEVLLGGPWPVTLVKANEVIDLDKMLQILDEEWLRQKLLWLKSRVEHYGRHDEEQYTDLLYSLYSDFGKLKEFYEKAARARLPVVCTTSPF